MNSMSLGTWPIIGIVSAILVVGAVGSKLVHGSGESTDVASYEGGKTRRNRKGSRFKK